MLSKIRQRKDIILVALCVSLTLVFLSFILWPRPCGDFLRQENELTFYFVTPIFSDASPLPNLIPEQRTLDFNSDEFQEILSIMDKYLCHITLDNSSKNNHATWVTVYNADGFPVFTYTGTNRFCILGTNYSIYGSEDDASNMINSIHAILFSEQQERCRNKYFCSCQEKAGTKKNIPQKSRSVLN